MIRATLTILSAILITTASVAQQPATRPQATPPTKPPCTPCGIGNCPPPTCDPGSGQCTLC